MKKSKIIIDKLEKILEEIEIVPERKGALLEEQQNNKDKLSQLLIEGKSVMLTTYNNKMVFMPTKIKYA